MLVRVGVGGRHAGLHAPDHAGSAAVTVTFAVLHLGFAFHKQLRLDVGLAAGLLAPRRRARKLAGRELFKDGLGVARYTSFFGWGRDLHMLSDLHTVRDLHVLGGLHVVGGRRGEWGILRRGVFLT